VLLKGDRNMDINSLSDFLLYTRESHDQETNNETPIDDQENSGSIGLITLGDIYRNLLEEITWIICPICKKHLDIGYNNVLDGKYHKLQCTNCRQELGYISGIVGAKKLGSYIRLRDEQGDQKSVNIFLFKSTFDVRNKDKVSIIYHLKTSDKTPVLIINNTIGEYWVVEYNKDYNEDETLDFTQEEALQRLEDYISGGGVFMYWGSELEELLGREPTINFEP
jgi:hypothetical protein